MSTKEKPSPTAVGDVATAHPPGPGSYGRPPQPAAHVRRRILAALGEEVAGAGFDRLTVTCKKHR